MRYREVRSRGCDDVDSAAVAMVPVVLRLEEDCRERMVYLAHLYFESAIRDYVPSSEDIDYPRKLYGIHSSNASNSDFYAKKRQMESRSSSRGLLSYSENMPWFPPVQHVLRALSLLYTSIDVIAISSISLQVHRHGRLNRGSRFCDAFRHPHGGQSDFAERSGFWFSL